MTLEEFKSWIYRMEHYGTISGGTVSDIMTFVSRQEEEIKRLRGKEQLNEK